MGKKALSVSREDMLTKPFREMKLVLADRDTCENDPENIQIIPYIVLRDIDSGKIFAYQRGNGGDEDKLKAKWSIGIGGHIDELPRENEDPVDLIAREACREMQEEVGIVIDPIDCSIHEQILQHPDSDLDFIYLPMSDNTVDHVHAGLVIIQNINRDELGDHEAGVIEKGEWFSPGYLFTEVLSFETDAMIFEYWSLIALNQLINETVDSVIQQIDRFHYVANNHWAENV